VYTLSNVPTPEEVTPPAVLPVTIEEAKQHLNLSSSDNAHNAIIAQYIAAARLQFETDCSLALITRDMRLRLPSFCEFRFPVGPLVSIASVEYIDSNGDLQTLDESAYVADTANDAFRMVTWSTPSVADRWDAVAINYTIGKANTQSEVNPLAKSAILLMVGYYFENRDMLVNDGVHRLEAYEKICRLLHRSSYP